MDHPFQNMEEDRQKVILNSAFKEFADHGYKRSSLNRILQDADLSKGVFYHYFKNKESFYSYIIERGIQIVIDKLHSEKLIEEQDFITRMQLGALYKVHIAKAYPRLFDCLAVYYKTITPEEYLEIVNKMSGNMANRLLTENIDYSLFREDKPLPLLMKVVNRYITSVATEISEHINEWDIDQITSYYQNELEDIRQIVYKEKETTNE